MSKIQIVDEDVNVDDFDDRKLPSDVHLVTFTKDGKLTVHAVRAYTKVDIFDEYYDKLGKDNPIHSLQLKLLRLSPP